MSEANKHQVGGDHYKVGGEEHWDRAYRLQYDPFQYIITKWVERWKKKGGIQDLHKARHALDKYIEIAEQQEREYQGLKAGAKPARAGHTICESCGDKIPLGFHSISRFDPNKYLCGPCALEESGIPGAEYVNQ